MKRLNLIVVVELFYSLFFVPVAFTGPSSNAQTRVHHHHDIKNYEDNVKYHDDSIQHHEIFQRRHQKTAEIYRKKGEIKSQNAHLKLKDLHEEAKLKHEYAKTENEKEIQKLNINNKNKIRSALIGEKSMSTPYASQLTEKARAQSQLTHQAETDRPPLKETEEQDTHIPSR